MCEVGAGHEGDATPAGRDRLAERVEEPGHSPLVLRPPAAHHGLVHEARQHRHDRDLAAAREEVAEEHRLELDRVLVAVRPLGGEAVLARPRAEPLDEIHVDRGRAQRRVVRLARERERVRHPGVTGAEDHEQVGVAALGEVAVAPGVGGAAAVKVDVRRDQRADGLRAGTAAVDRPRALGRDEEAVEHRTQGRAVGRVRAAGMAGRPCRRREERAVDLGAARLEGRALEEPVLVERLRELLDARGLHHLALVAKDRLLDLGDVVASVEERDDLEQRAREHHDRRRVAGGIAQRQEALALVLDRERLDAAQARPPRACPPGGRPCPPGGGAHGFRYASAAAA